MSFNQAIDSVRVGQAAPTAEQMELMHAADRENGLDDQQTSVGEIDEYVATHPSLSIKPDALVALRTALPPTLDTTNDAAQTLSTLQVQFKQLADEIPGLFASTTEDWRTARISLTSRLTRAVDEARVLVSTKPEAAIVVGYANAAIIRADASVHGDDDRIATPILLDVPTNTSESVTAQVRSMELSELERILKGDGLRDRLAHVDDFTGADIIRALGTALRRVQIQCEHLTPTADNLYVRRYNEALRLLKNVSVERFGTGYPDSHCFPDPIE